MREEIEYFYDHLQRIIHNDKPFIPSMSYDLVLDTMVTDDSDDRIAWS